MNDFLLTVETVPPGRGFAFFGTTHLLWLSLFVLGTIGSCIWYRKLSQRGKGLWKLWVTILLLVAECFKFLVLLVGGHLSWEYLPMHLCSINIFLICIHAVRPTKLLGNFLYCVCIPGAVAALLFPGWSSLPVTSALHIHSFFCHILLAMYPIVLTANGEIRPDTGCLPGCALLLLLLAGFAYCVNWVLGTNYMFLMGAGPDNPLYWFARNWGSHLWGFPVITAVVWLVMYLPVILSKKFNQ